MIIETTEQCYKDIQWIGKLHSNDIRDYVYYEGKYYSCFLPSNGRMFFFRADSVQEFRGLIRHRKDHLDFIKLNNRRCKLELC
jgi:hypothetical protein